MSNLTVSTHFSIVDFSVSAITTMNQFKSECGELIIFVSVVVHVNILSYWVHSGSNYNTVIGFCHGFGNSKCYT